MEDIKLLNRKFMIIAIFLVSLLAISAVSASDENITDEVISQEMAIDDNFEIVPEDTVMTDGAEGTFTELQDMINNAEKGSTLTLERDYVYDDGFNTSGISISKDITIEGNGHILNAFGKSRILDVHVVDFAVNNVKFYNGYSNAINAASGGLMGKDFTIKVNNCIFENNTGSAIYCQSININDSIFLNNGQSIFVYNDIFAKNCNFINHTSNDGGALYVYGGTVDGVDYNFNIVNCNFTNNSASNSGGAIHSFNKYDLLNITSCIFNSNEAKYGGAIYCCGVLLVDNSEFICSSGKEGGAVYSDSKSISSSSRYTTLSSYKALIINSNFINNTCSWHGGALCCNGGSDAIAAMNCIFKGNCADWYAYGGAIYNVSAINCVFDSNYGTNGSDGGAIYNGYAEDCIFVNNSAEGYGGAIYLGSAVSCSFVRNENAIYNGSAVNCNFTDNERAIYKGSAVNCTFVNNAVKYSGGAIYEGSAVNCIFVNNSAKYDGGAMYLGSAVNCNFTGNFAGGEGDHIYGTSCENCNFVNTVILSSDVTKYYGSSQKCIVNLTENKEPLANVNVKITLNGKTSTVKTDSKGQASVDLDLPVGEYNLTAVYEGVSTTSKVTVKSTVSTADASGTYLNSKVSATFLDVNGNAFASKQVTFKVGDKTYTAKTNDNGVATANIDLNVGTYTVTAVNPVNNEQKEFKLIINKASSAVSLAASQVNGATTLTATLTPANATGNVIFNINGEDKTAAIKNGKATLSLSDLKAGNYSVTASYGGDNNLNASTSNTVTFKVDETYPVLTAEPVTKTYGTSTNLVVFLTDNKGNAIANEYVKVVIGSTVNEIKTDSNGQATFAIDNAPGEYVANITYATAQTTAKINVKKATPKITASKKSYKVSVKTKKYTLTLKINGKVMKSTYVSLKVNKKTYTEKTNSKGKATFKITNLKKKGTYSAKITYKATKYYNKATKTVKIIVKK